MYDNIFNNFCFVSIEVALRSYSYSIAVSVRAQIRAYMRFHKKYVSAFHKLTL